MCVKVCVGGGGVNQTLISSLPSLSLLIVLDVLFLFFVFWNLERLVIWGSTKRVFKIYLKRQDSRRAARMIKQTVPLSWTLHTNCKLSTLYSVVQGRRPSRLVTLLAVSFSDRLRVGGMVGMITSAWKVMCNRVRTRGGHATGNPDWKAAQG